MSSLSIYLAAYNSKMVKTMVTKFSVVTNEKPKDIICT